MSNDRGIVRKDRELQAFIQTFRELHPIFVQANVFYSLETKDHEAFFISIFGLHDKLLSELSIVFDINSDSLIDRVFKQKLSQDIYRIISHFIRHDNGLSFVPDKIMETVMAMAAVVKKSFTDNLVLTDPLVNHDLVLTIKNTLLLFSIRFDRYVSILFEEQQGIGHVEWYNRYISHLAKDIAFNWSEQANITEKERLFADVLGVCGDVVLDAWLDELAVGTTLRSDISAKSFWDADSELRQAIEKFNLGYAHSNYRGMDWLKAEMYTLLDQTVREFLGDEYANQKQSIRAICFDRAQKQMAKEWISFHGDIVAEYKALGESGKRLWRLTKGRDPADFERFRRRLSSACLFVRPIISVAPDRTRIEIKAKSKLASLWGISNAICKVKKVGT